VNRPSESGGIQNPGAGSLPLQALVCQRKWPPWTSWEAQRNLVTPIGIHPEADKPGVSRLQGHEETRESVA
jgi:hypothetical protein